MAEKTQFKDLIDAHDTVYPDQKACANCAHGRDAINEQNGQRYILCKAGPPHVILEPVQSALGQRALVVKNRWPAMALDEECDAFGPRLES